MDIIDETGTFYIDNFEYGFNGCDPGIYWIDKIYNSEGYCNEGPMRDLIITVHITIIAKTI